MDKRNWKILFSNYSGVEKKAVELVNEEVGRQILRDKGVYSLHVLTCEKVGASIEGKNIVVHKECTARYNKDLYMASEDYCRRLLYNNVP